MNSISRKAKEIFVSLVDDVPPEEWDHRVDEACQGDDELRRRVHALLLAHAQPDSRLERVAIDFPLTLDHPTTKKPGTRIGPYKLLQRLGEGGMGEVYMAEQTEPVERRVALKIIKAGMDSQQVIARFEAERQALAMMDHPNIARVIDAGTTETGRPFFVMELVKGLPITQYCDEHRLDLRQRMQLFRKVCHAVQHAHQKGIIHRDLKPSNVMVAEYDDTPVPKIIDFGVAKATQRRLTEKTMFTEVGTIVGTIEYMSPEQAKLNQLDVDTRSDIYSLGVLLYELLAGETPFDRSRLRSAALDEMLRIIREEEPSRPSIKLNTSESLPSIAANRHVEPQKLGVLLRGELDWIVMKAMEKDRSRRYDSASNLVTDIENFLNDEPVEARPPSTWYRLSKSVRRNRAAFGAAAAIFLVLLLGLAATTYQSVRASRAELSARTQASLAEQARNAAEQSLIARQQEEESRMRAEENELAAQQQAEIAASHVVDVSKFLRETLREFAMAATFHFRDEAMGILESNRIRVLEEFDDQPNVRTVLLNELANAMFHTNERNRAEEIARESVALLLETPEIDHQVAADSYALLGYMASRSSRYEVAMKASERVLSHLDQITLPNARTWKTRHTALLRRMSASHQLNQPELCEQACRQWLAQEELKIGNSSLTVYYFLSWAQEQLGQMTEAIEAQSKVVELQKARSGGVSVISSHCDLAGLLVRSGQPDKAADVLAQVVRDLEVSPARFEGPNELSRLHHELAQIAWLLRESRLELTKLMVRDAATVAEQLSEVIKHEWLRRHLQANQWVLDASANPDSERINKWLVDATDSIDTVLGEANRDPGIFERIKAIQDPHVTLQRIAELQNDTAKRVEDQATELKRLLAESKDLSEWHDELTRIRYGMSQGEGQRKHFQRTLDRLIADARQALPDQRGRLIECLAVMATLQTRQKRVDQAERCLVEALDHANEDLNNGTRVRPLLKSFERLTASSGPTTKEGKAWLEAYESAPWKLDLQSDAMAACLANQKQLDGGKQQWAIDHGKTGEDEPYAYQLVDYFKVMPTCPGGGEYHIGKVKDRPVCTVHGTIADIEKRRADQQKRRP